MAIAINFQKHDGNQNEFMHEQLYTCYCNSKIIMSLDEINFDHVFQFLAYKFDIKPKIIFIKYLVNSIRKDVIPKYQMLGQ